MDRPLRGWCKILFAISLICWPTYFAMSELSAPILVGVTLISSLGLVMILFLTHSQRLPKLHNVSELFGGNPVASPTLHCYKVCNCNNVCQLQWISFWGLIVGFIMVSIISSEMNILIWQMFHYIFDWYDDTIVLIGFPFGYVFVGKISIKDIPSSNFII